MDFKALLKNILLIGISLFTLSISAQHQKSCQHTKHEYDRIQNDPSYLEKRSIIEKNTKKFITNYRNNRITNEKIHTLPVVVHIIYHEDFPEQNLSNDLVKSQIDVLNEDFSKTNTNFSTTPEDFKPLAADVNIRFQLANVDPNGNFTTGITRTVTTTRRIGKTSDYYQTSKGGIDAWDVTQYINIWVCELASRELGFAYFPTGSVIQDDGLVISPDYFGRVENSSNLGRTTTHEMGHYLNLSHIWGDNGGCSDDDNVDDTPLQSGSRFGCPSHPVSSCGSNDIVSNFMDYVNDECMTMFTHGQKKRMLATLEGPRKGLLTSKGIDTTMTHTIEKHDKVLSKDYSVTISPNPTQKSFTIKSDISNIANITIYTLIGQFIYEQQVMIENPIDVSYLQNGTYILKIEQEGLIYTKRIIVNQ